MIVNKYRILSYSMFIFGVIFIVLAYYLESYIFYFFSVSFIFWGILFLIILPGNYLELKIMESLYYSYIASIKHLLIELGLKGVPFYFPIPKEFYLPYDIGYKKEFIYVSKKGSFNKLLLEDAIKKNPTGIRLNPPSVFLTDYIEKKYGVDFSTMSEESLLDFIKKILIYDLNFMENFTYNKSGDIISIQIKGSIFISLLKENEDIGNNYLQLCCPLSSLIACMIVRTIKRPLLLKEFTFNHDKIGFIINLL